MKIIGLTGGISTGKSTVSNYLLQKGYLVIDADLVAREVVLKGSEGLRVLVDAFGEGILSEVGELDRKRLGQLIFHDEEKRQLLNRLLHPLIRQKILDSIETYRLIDPSIVFLDIPLLFETDYSSLCDEVWVVFVNDQVQLERLMLRDQLNEQEALKRLDSQWSIHKKAKLATRVINNERSLEETYQQVDVCLNELLKI